MQEHTYETADVGQRPGSPACWTSIRDAERHIHARDGTVRAAVRRGEIAAYRRPGRREAAIVDLRDVDDWVRGTWEKVCEDDLG